MDRAVVRLYVVESVVEIVDLDLFFIILDHACKSILFLQPSKVGLRSSTTFRTVNFGMRVIIFCLIDYL